MSESLTLQQTYRFRVEPTPEQAQALARFAGTRRWIWNWALARKRAYYAEHGKGIRFAQLCAELTALKDQPDTAWLKDIDSQLLQQALRDLEQAFTNFFEHRARYPRFVRRGKLDVKEVTLRVEGPGSLPSGFCPAVPT